MNDGMKWKKMFIYFSDFCLFAISESPDSLKWMRAQEILKIDWNNVVVFVILKRIS